MPLFPDIRVALRLALRARFGSIALWLVLALCASAWMAAQFSGRQPSTVALDVGLSVIRLGLPVFTILLLQELLSQEFVRRHFLSSMTYPRARHNFLLGRFLATAVLTTALLLVLAAVLAGTVSVIGEGYKQSTPVALDRHYVITIAFIALDLLVIMAMGTLIAVSASTPSFVLIGSLGFMLVARSFSAIIALLTVDSTLVHDAQGYQSSLALLGYVLPDLGTLDVRMITLYGRLSFLPPDWAYRVLSCIAYVAGLLGLSIWVLGRKRFA